MTVDRDHLAELIVKAKSEPEAKYEQQPGTYVRQAEDEFDDAGLGRQEVPRAAIAKRAQELLEAERAERA
jgi:hypothetical protein